MAEFLSRPISRGAAFRMLIEAALIDSLHVPLEHNDKHLFEPGVLSRLSDIRDHSINVVELLRQQQNPGANPDRDDLLRSFLALTSSLDQFKVALLGAFSAVLADDQPLAVTIAGRT
jgi:hypothetical protein